VQMQHRFTVPAPIEAAWEALNDVQGVGSCFPGASVTKVEADDFTGTCKIKLGPISMLYSGSGRFVERDATGHRAVIEAKGRDKRGNGTAAVTITTVLSAESEERTSVAVDTDLHITGRPAQFGRGVIQDVSDKLLGQFTECLESKIGVAEEKGAAAESSPATVPESGSAASDGAGASGSERAGATSGPADSALDLGATVLPVLAKRYAPHAIGVLAVLLILWRVLRH
jgi:uncharacterized protein